MASITGLVAKKTSWVPWAFSTAARVRFTATLASTFTAISGYSFLAFNLLCAPCFAAMGAIKREMNNAKWTWFAIGYQCLFAYAISLIIYQVGLIFTGGVQIVGLIAAIALTGLILYMLLKPHQESNRLTEKVKVA